MNAPPDFNELDVPGFATEAVSEEVLTMPKYPIKDSFVLAVTRDKKTTHVPVNVGDKPIELSTTTAAPLIKAGVIGAAMDTPAPNKQTQTPRQRAGAKENR